MKKGRRLIIATLTGVLCGIICFWFASSGPTDLAWPVAVQILLSRTLIGFAIGLSRFTLGHWTIHGLVMGFVFSLPLAFSGLMAPDDVEFSRVWMFAATVIMGMIYGLLIELVTSVAFKAKLEK